MMTTISISGNLYFTNVETKDRTDGDGYVCMVENEFLCSLSKSGEEMIYPVSSPGTNWPPPSRLAGRGGCVPCFVMQMSNRYQWLPDGLLYSRCQSLQILVGFRAVYSIAVLIIYCCEICKQNCNLKIGFKEIKNRKNMRTKQWLTLTPKLAPGVRCNAQRSTNVCWLTPCVNAPILYLPRESALF